MNTILFYETHWKLEKQVFPCKSPLQRCINNQKKRKENDCLKIKKKNGTTSARKTSKGFKSLLLYIRKIKVSGIYRYISIEISFFFRGYFSSLRPQNTPYEVVSGNITTRAGPRKKKKNLKSHTYIRKSFVQSARSRLIAVTEKIKIGTNFANVCSNSAPSALLELNNSVFALFFSLLDVDFFLVGKIWKKNRAQPEELQERKSVFLTILLRDWLIRNFSWPKEAKERTKKKKNRSAFPRLYFPLVGAGV